MKVKEYYEDVQNLLTHYLEQLGIKITAENIDTFTDEQFAQIRHNGFGASDSSRILGVNPFPNGSAEDLLLEKINETVDESIGQKATVRMGKDLEDFIMNKFIKTLEEFHPVAFHLFKPIHMYGRSSNGLNTNFDGVLLDRESFIPVEIKTISVWGRKYYDFNKSLTISPTDSEDILQDFRDMTTEDIPVFEDSIEKTILARSKFYGVPPYYYTQLQQQIDFLNSQYGYILVLDVSEWTIRIFRIPRDQETITELNTRAELLYFRLCVSKYPERFEDDGEDI